MSHNSDPHEIPLTKEFQATVFNDLLGAIECLTPDEPEGTSDNDQTPQPTTDETVELDASDYREDFSKVYPSEWLGKIVLTHTASMDSTKNPESINTEFISTVGPVSAVRHLSLTQHDAANVATSLRTPEGQTISIVSPDGVSEEIPGNMMDSEARLLQIIAQVVMFRSELNSELNNSSFDF